MTYDLEYYNKIKKEKEGLTHKVEGLDPVIAQILKDLVSEFDLSFTDQIEEAFVEALASGPVYRAIVDQIWSKTENKHT